MTAGKDHDKRDNSDHSKPDRGEAEPVSLPENADLRYDEKEARDPGREADPRYTKRQA